MDGKLTTVQNIKHQVLPVNHYLLFVSFTKSKCPTVSCLTKLGQIDRAAREEEREVEKLRVRAAG